MTDSADSISAPEAAARAACVQVLRLLGYDERPVEHGDSVHLHAVDYPRCASILLALHETWLHESRFGTRGMPSENARTQWLHEAIRVLNLNDAAAIPPGTASLRSLVARLAGLVTASK